jgi:hypothetical protein
MKQFVLISMMAMWVSVAGAAVEEGFFPWDDLIDDFDLGPNWQLSTGQAQANLYSINGGAYPLGFGLARNDGGARGMNGLVFVQDGNAVGHHVSSMPQGHFEVLNSGDTNTFEDLLLMVTLDAKGLDNHVGLTLSTDANTLDVNDQAYHYNFDPNTDFVYYDPNALGYDTGRPSGLYWNTTPSTNPATYLFNQGMVSIYALEKIYLAPSASTRVYYDISGLDCRVVFSVYGSVKKKDKHTGETVTLIYHTNRDVVDANEVNADVSSFAVVPPCWSLDLDGSGRVDVADLLVIGDYLGWVVDETSPAILHRVDVDGNGLIEWQDVSAFADQVVTLCP